MRSMSLPDPAAPHGSPLLSRHDAAPPAAPVAVVTEHPMTFTGTAGEYFRIWIVNVALTVVTLGVYLPWARVRTRQYFYGHTWVDGQNFEYRANPLALRQAKDEGLTKLALVGMGCQTSSPPIMWDRKAGKVSKPFVFNIGLLCSKTFDDAIFPELFEAKYGLQKSEMVKMNIKGVFQIWMKDGSYHEIDLKECHQWTREGCKMCPDFAAEHADISTGGIGKFNDWTLTIVRTDAGRDLMARMLADGVIQVRPGDDDPDAIALMHKLSRKSRKRWPEFAIDAPRLLPTPAS